MDSLIIYGAKYLIFAIAIGVAAYAAFLPREQQVRAGLMLLVALPLAWALARIAGMLFSHQQPFATGGFEPLIPHDIDNSFPSDHSALAMGLAGVTWFFNRNLGALLCGAAVVVGISRMLAGLHYPIDIFAGLAIGALAAHAGHVAVFYFLRR